MSGPLVSELTVIRGARDAGAIAIRAGDGRDRQVRGPTVMLLSRRGIHVPRRNIGRTLTFADGSRAVVYRETVLDAEVRHPCVLLVEFRLRWVRGWWHRAFRWESWLNTPLFAGFPGFASKLWLAADDNGYYRAVYEWDGVERADEYARALWWALMVVSERESIHYEIVANLKRDAFLGQASPIDTPSNQWWWRPVAA